MDDNLGVSEHFSPLNIFQVAFSHSKTTSVRECRIYEKRAPPKFEQSSPNLVKQTSGAYIADTND